MIFFALTYAFNFNQTFDANDKAGLQVLKQIINRFLIR